jgi:peroxisomal 2,4-dienoyl-CoA reductase
MTFNPGLLEGRAALVTGGGTGICRGIALMLAAHGCDVAIVSRRLEHLIPAADEIRATGARALALAADVRDAPAMDKAATETVEQFGRLDILINGAAGNFVCLAEALSPNGFGTVVDIDLKGTFNASKAALPHLKLRGGAIVNISATLQYCGTVGQVHASAAKAGVDTLTRTLAVEWGRYGIRVNGVAPGPTEDTEGIRRLTTARAREDLIRHCPLGRLATIEDVSKAVLFLVSNAALFINGVTLVVDGGLWLQSSRVLGEPAE